MQERQPPFLPSIAYASFSHSFTCDTPRFFKKNLNAKFVATPRNHFSTSCVSSLLQFYDMQVDVIMCYVRLSGEEKKTFSHKYKIQMTKLRRKIFHSSEIELRENFFGIIYQKIVFLKKSEFQNEISFSSFSRLVRMLLSILTPPVSCIISQYNVIHYDSTDITHETYSRTTHEKNKEAENNNFIFYFLTFEERIELCKFSRVQQ